MMERMGISDESVSAACYSCICHHFLQNEPSVVLLLPILQVLQEVYKGWLIQNALLSERVEVERISKRLHELQLKLEARSVGTPNISGRLGLGHGGRDQGRATDAPGGCLVPRLLANKHPDLDAGHSHMTGATRQYGAWQSRWLVSLHFLSSYHFHQLLETCTTDMSGDDDSSGWQLTESDPGVFTCETF